MSTMLALLCKFIYLALKQLAPQCYLHSPSLQSRFPSTARGEPRAFSGEDNGPIAREGV